MLLTLGRVVSFRGTVVGFRFSGDETRTLVHESRGWYLWVTQGSGVVKVICTDIMQLDPRNVLNLKHH